VNAHLASGLDLFGFADVLAVHPRDRLFLLVQCATAGHAAHRLDRARRRPELLDWFKAGGIFEVHGWSKRGNRWTVRRVAVQAEDLAAAPLRSQPTRRKKRDRQPLLFS
jgi:hypothetical protein